MSLRVKFIKSAVNKADYPLDKRPEIAIVGRSNSGKSSLVNAICGKKIAKVSQKPGKTCTLNFFLGNDEFYFVDMPGYGFAKRSPAEQNMWKGMIEGYIANRKNLKGLLLIMDVRRKWTEDEEMLVKWVAHVGRPVCVILNKSDKAKQGERVKAQRLVASNEFVDNVFCTSATTGKGIEPMLKYVYDDWVQEAF